MRLSNGKKQRTDMKEEGKSDLAIAFALSVFYCLLSFVLYVLLLPLLPDAVWVNEYLDSFLKSAAISIAPALILLLILYFLRRISVSLGILIIIPILAICSLVFSFMNGDEDRAILIAFSMAFIIPPSITGCIASSLSLVMASRRNKD